MSHRTLRDDICDHYAGQELPPKTLARLAAMSDAVDQRPAPSTIQGLTIQRIAIAAGLLLAAALATLWVSINPSDPSTYTLSEAIAQEVALNHNKGLPADLPTHDFAELRRQMDKLDFALVQPKVLEKRGLRLLGGRYCSIQGRIAAQLKLETPAGDPVTLYQTARVPELTPINTVGTRSQGLTISLWHEHGVFFGLAQSPPPPKSDPETPASPG